VAPLFAGGSGDGSARRRWTDRIVGILVGALLGLGVLAYFVFVQSEGTIDAPKVNEGKEQATVPAPAPEQPEKGKKKKPKSKQVPVVRVIGGAPPEGAGPTQLHFKKGEKVRFEIETSEPFSFEIKGLDITESIERTSTISFKATKAGQFPVIATATLIGVADILIAKK